MGLREKLGRAIGTVALCIVVALTFACGGQSPPAPTPVDTPTPTVAPSPSPTPTPTPHPHLHPRRHLHRRPHRHPRPRPLLSRRHASPTPVPRLRPYPPRRLCSTPRHRPRHSDPTLCHRPDSDTRAYSDTGSISHRELRRRSHGGNEWAGAGRVFHCHS